MILFKAINYKEDSPKKMTSDFKGEYLEHSCFEDIITTAFSHVSSGDKKKIKDYWISTTKNIYTAIELMNNDKYDYNGIAIINLSETNQTGFIYDEILREKGYIAKDIINNVSKQLWKPNKDGMVLSLDMSSVFTINYLASYLWLKGNRDSLGNIRTYLNAKSKYEVLLLCENISFEFISKEDIEQHDLISKFSKEQNIITDYYATLYKDFIELAPESEFKEERIKAISDISKIDESKYKYYDYYEMENKRKEVISSFYKNAKYTFDRQRAKRSFYELNKLYYEDKDIIDLNEYEFIKPYDDSKISSDYYLWAYVCSGAYMHLKLTGKLKERRIIWQIINKLYKDSVISGKVHKKDFFEYYIKGLGIYPNSEPKRCYRDYKLLIDDMDCGF